MPMVITIYCLYETMIISSYSKGVKNNHISYKIFVTTLQSYRNNFVIAYIIYSNYNGNQTKYCHQISYAITKLGQLSFWVVWQRQHLDHLSGQIAGSQISSSYLSCQLLELPALCLGLPFHVVLLLIRHNITNVYLGNLITPTYLIDNFHFDLHMAMNHLIIIPPIILCHNKNVLVTAILLLVSIAHVVG